MADGINNNQQSTIVIDTDHVDYNHTKAYQPNQTERYDEVGSHSYLYKFDNNPDTFEDGTKVIPTMEAMNVYSAYVKDYIDHKDNVLGVNLASQGETLAAIDQKITNIYSNLEIYRDYLNNRSILVMTYEFAEAFKNLDNYNDIAIPIIPEFFEAYKGRDDECFYSITNYIDPQNNLDLHCSGGELNKIKNNSQYDSSYGNTEAAKTRFKLYLQHCFNDNGSQVEYNSSKNIYNNLDEIGNNDITIWGKKNRCNSLPIYTTNNDYACDKYTEFATVRHFLEFYPFPYRCLLPADMFSWVSDAYDQAPVLYDPYNNRIYEYGAKYISQTKFMHHSIRVKSSNEDYRTGIGYGNARKNSMFFHNLRDADYKQNTYLFQVFGTNRWTQTGNQTSFDTNPKNRFNNMFAAQAEALYKIQTGDDYSSTFREDNDILDVLNTDGVLSDNSLIIGDGPFYETDFHGAACIDNSITNIDEYTTYVPEQYQDKYPWGAIIMHYHVAAEIPSTVIWQFIGNDKFDNDHDIQFYRYYNQDELHKLFFNNVSILHNTPQIGDYIYDLKTSELLEIAKINQTSHYRSNEFLYACATPIYSEIAGNYQRGTYIKGNSFIPYLNFDWTDVILPEDKPSYTIDYTQAILSGDPSENEAITFNAFNFLPYRLQQYVHETHVGSKTDDEICEIWKPVLRSQHNLFKEGDILLYQNHIYEVVESPYAYPDREQSDQEEMQLDYDWQIWALNTIKIGELDVSGIPGAKGETGPQGQQGKSAYQVACDQGYQGTEAEWLQSLKGEKGDPGAGGTPILDVYRENSNSGLSIYKNGQRIEDFNTIYSNVNNLFANIIIHLANGQNIIFTYSNANITEFSSSIYFNNIYNVSSSTIETRSLLIALHGRTGYEITLPSSISLQNIAITPY